MARDRKVYGFRKARAEALLALPLSGDVEFAEVRPRERRSGQVEVDVITGVTLTSTHLEFSLTRIWVNKSEELEDVIQIDLDSCEEEPEE